MNTKERKIKLRQRRIHKGGGLSPTSIITTASVHTDYNIGIEDEQYGPPSMLNKGSAAQARIEWWLLGIIVVSASLGCYFSL